MQVRHRAQSKKLGTPSLGVQCCQHAQSPLSEVAVIAGAAATVIHDALYPGDCAQFFQRVCAQNLVVPPVVAVANENSQHSRHDQNCEGCGRLNARQFERD